MKDDVSILVVDDEPIVINSCERVLKDEGYNVHSALRGRDAMLLMEENIYSLIFTDLKMPEMDGITLIEWIRRSKPDTGVVVITGYPSQQTLQEALNLGCIDYVPKPFTPLMLIDATHRALREVAKRPADEIRITDFSPETARELDITIDNYLNTPGSLIPILQKAQELVGYLPAAVQRHISARLNMPVSEIQSVVSFYSFFTMKPRGKHLIRLCAGTACHVKRAEEIFNRLRERLGVGVGEVTPDKRFSLEEVRCLGCCALAPVVMVDQKTYSSMNLKKVDELIGRY